MLPVRAVPSCAIGQLARRRGYRCSQWPRSISTNGLFEENDVILLKKKRNARREPTPTLTKPLLSGHKIRIEERGDGFIFTDVILGKAPRSVVHSMNGTEFRIHTPTLSDYTRFTPRLVTPIYPQDANLIVSLLDLCPSPPSLLNVVRSTLSREKSKEIEELIPVTEQDNEGPLEIFEAGTGHGALTLHLARAIMGANAPAPPIPKPRAEAKLPRTRTRTLYASEMFYKPNDIGDLSKNVSSIPSEEVNHPTSYGDLSKDSEIVVEESIEDGLVENELKEQEAAYENYLSHRRAIVQSLDINPGYSAHAQKTVRNFRQGILFPHINFHVGTIPDYLSNRLSERDGQPFLSHAILDLPNTHEYLDIVAQAMKLDGNLVIWNPSITQITKCVEVVKEKRLPWVLDRVLELGLAAGVGGREWDIQSIRPRAVERAMAKAVQEKPEESQGGELDEGSAPIDENAGFLMICRPKVGVRIEGGGFLALWKKGTDPVT